MLCIAARNTSTERCRYLGCDKRAANKARCIAVLAMEAGYQSDETEGVAPLAT
jgi:hypothetical protein